jgi:drug/metabolite transporter (DMT)-like permease
VACPVETATPPPPPKAESALSPALRGIGWMMACGMLFGLLNAAQKFLAHELHPPQVLCLRYLVGSAVLLPFVVRAGWEAYRPHNLSLLTLRGAVHLLGTIICCPMSRWRRTPRSDSPGRSS